MILFFRHYLCLFEHNPVYTVGLREHLFLKDEENRLKNLDVEFYRYKLEFFFRKDSITIF